MKVWGSLIVNLVVYNTICEHFALCVLKLHQSSFKLLSAWLQCHVDLVFPDHHCSSIWWIIQFVQKGQDSSVVIVTRGQHLLFQGWSGWGVKLAIRLHLVVRLRMSGPTTPLACMLSWLSQGQLYIHLYRDRCSSCNFLHPIVTSSLSGPNIFLTTLLLNFLNRYASDQTHINGIN